MGFVRSLVHRPRADFAGAQIGRLTLDWIMAHRSADQEIRGSLITLRDRASRLPTWPWPPQLLGGFVSALLLPVVVYLLTRFASTLVGT